MVGVGSKHGTKGASKGTNVPSIEPATDFVEGAFSAHRNRQRSEEVGRARRRSAEAQARTLKDGQATVRETMKNNVEPWMELCELAARESDANKLMKLTEEIVRLLDEKRKPPLAHSRTPQDRRPT